MKDKKVYAKTIVRKQNVEDQDKPPKVSKVRERNRQNPSLADDIAGDFFCYIHQYYPGGAKAFPDRPRLQMTDKFYPYAVGGPLYLDEPKFEFLINECKLKEPVIRASGVRYVLILPDMTKEEALAQLGETCGQPLPQTYAI